MTLHITVRRVRLKDFITSDVDSDNDSRLKVPNPHTDTPLLKELKIPEGTVQVELYASRNWVHGQLYACYACMCTAYI
jgi:hypothetical protein